VPSKQGPDPHPRAGFDAEAFSFVDRVGRVDNASVDCRTCLGCDLFHRACCLTSGHSKKAPGWLAGANQCRSKPSVSRRAQHARRAASARRIGDRLPPRAQKNRQSRTKKRPQAGRHWGLSYRKAGHALAARIQTTPALLAEQAERAFGRPHKKAPAMARRGKGPCLQCAGCHYGAVSAYADRQDAQGPAGAIATVTTASVTLLMTASPLPPVRRAGPVFRGRWA
jgi:hypothetical protein